MERNLKATLHLWGNSQGIRKSKELLNRLGIAINEEDNLSIDNDSLVIRKTVQRKTLEEYAKPFGEKLGPYEEFDFGEGIGIGRWLSEDN